LTIRQIFCILKLENKIINQKIMAMGKLVIINALSIKEEAFEKILAPLKEILIENDDPFLKGQAKVIATTSLDIKNFVIAFSGFFNLKVPVDYSKCLSDPEKAENYFEKFITLSQEEDAGEDEKVFFCEKCRVALIVHYEDEEIEEFFKKNLKTSITKEKIEEISFFVGRF